MIAAYTRRFGRWLAGMLEPQAKIIDLRRVLMAQAVQERRRPGK